MYQIHPIVVGTKVFDKSMMTYQYGNGQEYASYDMMLKVKDMADILLPLHEPEFASVDTIL